MNPLLVSGHAVFFRVARSKLVVDDYIRRTHNEYPARELPFDSLIIHNAGGKVSFESIRFLMEHNVPIFHMNWDGTLVGLTAPSGPISGELRLAQYQASLICSKRETIARSFIEEKIAKSLALLQFLQRYVPTVSLTTIRKEAANTRSSLLNYEGRVAQAYWSEYAKVIGPVAPEMEFHSRGQSSFTNNMGAADRVNSMLNYGYGFLEAKCRVVLIETGLDAEVGFLHQAGPGATPLVYDLMEPWRWLVDLSVWEVLRSRSVRKTDFLVMPDYRVRLNPEAVHALVARISENLNRRIGENGHGKEYETVLRDNARSLARFLVGESKKLSFSAPFKVEDSAVDAELRKRLLSMSVEERKRLGVSKTTYHYIKRNTMEGKAFRLYAKVRARI